MVNAKKETRVDHDMHQKKLIFKIASNIKDSQNKANVDKIYEFLSSILGSTLPCRLEDRLFGTSYFNISNRCIKNSSVKSPIATCAISVPVTALCFPIKLLTFNSFIVFSVASMNIRKIAFTWAQNLHFDTTSCRNILSFHAVFLQINEMQCVWMIRVKLFFCPTDFNHIGSFPLVDTVPKVNSKILFEIFLCPHKSTKHAISACFEFHSVRVFFSCATIRVVLDMLRPFPRNWSELRSPCFCN